MSLILRTGPLALAALLITAPAAASDRAQSLSRTQIQEAFVEQVRFEILVAISLPDSPDIDKAEDLKASKPIVLEEATLGRTWPYQYNNAKPDKDAEPPVTATMYPVRIEDLETAIAGKDWAKFYQQFARTVGALDGHDKSLRTPPTLDASLLSEAEFDAVAERLRKAFGGDLGKWKKVVPLARQTLIHLASRATDVFLAYAQRKEIKALAELPSNGLDKLAAAQEKTARLALKNQYIAYNLWSCLQFFPNRAESFKAKGYARVFDAFNDEVLELKARVDGGLCKHFP